MPSETILVINSSVTDTVVAALTGRGYRVVTATNGDEAVAVAAKERPQLVVVNGTAPKWNAVEVCQRLKNAPESRDIRVLMLTGRPQEFEAFWGLNRSADAYLAEPFARDELLYNVNRLI
jgi:DNA-binding response OmpR family regulator